MYYKQTQISYLMFIITFAVLVFFVWAYITSTSEPVSVDSGANLLVSTFMFLIVLLLSTFISLQVKINSSYIRIKFGLGTFNKNFPLNDIISAKAVKNPWYYGWGIRYNFKPKMWIYNVAGLGAVEIRLKNNKIYRIGTDESLKLEETILKVINKI
jgi:hypothetical protein